MWREWGRGAAEGSVVGREPAGANVPRWVTVVRGNVGEWHELRLKLVVRLGSCGPHSTILGALDMV